MQKITEALQGFQNFFPNIQFLEVKHFENTIHSQQDYYHHPLVYYVAMWNPMI